MYTDPCLHRTHGWWPHTWRPPRTAAAPPRSGPAAANIFSKYFPLVTVISAHGVTGPLVAAVTAVLLTVAHPARVDTQTSGAGELLSSDDKSKLSNMRVGGTQG